jgi:hypothetical protein
MEAPEMSKALLGVAEIELRSGESMDPALVFGVPGTSGKLVSYSHLRHLHNPADTAFPFDLLPPQRSFRKDGIDLFGLAYGVWQGYHGRLTAIPISLTVRQIGVVTLVGQLSQRDVVATFWPIIWENGAFKGYGDPAASASPDLDLLWESQDAAGDNVLPFAPP